MTSARILSASGVCLRLIAVLAPSRMSLCASQKNTQTASEARRTLPPPLLALPNLSKTSSAWQPIGAACAANDAFIESFASSGLAAGKA